MYQCILSVPVWNDRSKATYSQVHGSPVLKTFSFKSLNWVSATIFAELIHSLGKIQNLGEPELCEGKI